MASAPVGPCTGIKLTKRNKLAILKRAREILSDGTRWTTGKLRRGSGSDETYCVLGACEKAMYDLQIKSAPTDAFREHSDAGGYGLSKDIGLTYYSEKRYRLDPPAVNDSRGYDAVMELLDGYIAHVEGEK